jgi:hypothetical protein
VPWQKKRFRQQKVWVQAELDLVSETADNDRHILSPSCLPQEE